LQKGDCIYVFSDGVADQFGGEKGKKIGSKRLKEWLVSVSHLPTSEQYTRLKTDFENWQGSLEQTDDVTLIGVRV
jgi:serine phosphatase RsbU (regulator of sigma subunit)